MCFQILSLWGRDEHEFPDDELWSGAGNPRVRSCQGSVRSRILQLDPSHPIGLIVRPYVESFNCEYGACISLDQDLSAGIASCCLHCEREGQGL